MKEKRLLAAFITSAVTLITSLAITFGVVFSLADPVVATGVTRYEFIFNEANSSLISSNGNTLSLKDDIIYQPSSSIVWSDIEGEEAIWFNGATYEDEIVYADESIPTSLKVIPFRVSNKFTHSINVKISVNYDQTTMLGKYTYIKVYDYKNAEYVTLSNNTFYIDLTKNAYSDFAVVVCVDDSMNTSTNTINWGTDYQRIGLSIANQTIA